MLKRSISICILIPALLLFGDDLLTYREPGKLYVAVGREMVSSSAQFKQMLQNRGGDGLAKSKNWRSYMGSVEIMEHEFFQTAGAGDMAGAAQSHMRFLKTLDYLGPGIALTSCLVSLAGVVVIATQTATGEDQNPTTIYVGLVGVGVGLSLGVVRFLARGRRYPASVAVETADKYNKGQTK